MTTVDDKRTESERAHLQIVGFTLADEEYGLDVREVVGIERLKSVLRLPMMPRYIAGVMPIRDEMVPLVSLRRRFGLEDRPDQESTRVVVIEMGDLTIGLVVDAVTAVHRLKTGAIQEAPGMALTVDSRFVRGVLTVSEGRMLIFLDSHQILRSDETEQLAQALARQQVEAGALDV